MSEFGGQQIDLRGSTVDELKMLQADIEVEMERKRGEDRERFFRDAQEIAGKYGVSVDVFLNADVGRRKERAPAKYQNPNNSKQTWTGKGRQPTWIKELVAGGGTLEEVATG